MSKYDPRDLFNDPVYLRQESRRLRKIIGTLTDLEVKKEVAAHSFNLAQRAEAIARTQKEPSIMRMDVERPRVVLRTVADNAERQTVRDVPSQPENASNSPSKLRELAAWYRSFAERAGNPVIWEARLLMAQDLEAEAERIERRNQRVDPGHRNTLTAA